MVSIPRREIDSELQTLLMTGISQFANHIAFALLPRCVPDRVLCKFRGPHTETTVVLGRKDNALHARLLADSCPLSAIQIRRIKQFQRLIAETPFLVGVCVQRIVYEGIHLHILPPQLVLRRHRATWCRFCFLAVRMNHQRDQY